MSKLTHSQLQLLHAISRQAHGSMPGYGDEQCEEDLSVLKRRGLVSDGTVTTNGQRLINAAYEPDWDDW